MSEDVSLVIEVGSAVWFPCERGYPKWPGKVLECDGETAVVESFGDKIEYHDIPLKEVVLLTTETCCFVQSGKKKLKRRPTTWEMFMSSIKEAVSYIKEHDPQFSFSLDDSLDTSTSSPALESTPSTPADSPQLSSLIPKRSTGIRQSPRYRHTRFSQKLEQNGLNSSTDSVCTDPLVSSTPSYSRKRPALTSPPQSVKRACQTTNSENQARGSFMAAEKRTSRQQFDSGEIDSDTSAPVDILIQSSDQSLNDRGRNSQSSSEVHQVTSEKDFNGSQASVGFGDLPSSCALLTSSTPVASQSVACIATSVSESITKGTGDLLSHGTADDSVASSRSTPSYCMQPVASPVPSSEDDDELPAFNPAAENSKKTYVPAPNELVWVKFRRYPFWPALVSSLQNQRKKRKSRTVVNVFFLGDDEYEFPIGVRTLQNIRRYNSKNNTVYMLEAQKSTKHKEKIVQAAQEANLIIKLRLTKEIHGSPWEQFSEIVKRRPRPRVQLSPISPTTLPRENQPCNTSTAHFQFDPGDNGDDAQDSSSGTGSEDEGEEVMEMLEGGSLLYTFEKLRVFISSIKLTLRKICTGEEQSDLHDIFLSGKRKEQSQLRLLEKFGPAKYLPDSEKSDLVQLLERLTEPITGRKTNFGYTYDVLLPEAMVRSIAEFEGCSLDAAWKKLEIIDS